MGLFSKKDGRGGSRFMSGVVDEVHGGHLSGTDLVLFAEIREMQLPMVRATADTVSTDAGEFRLLYQPSRAFVVPEGELLVSASTVDRDLARDICARRELTGLLSVYTPYRDDAESLMFDATGGIPTEHASCRRFLSACMGNLRGSPGSSGLPGPMCCFGAFHLEGEDDPDVERRTKDETLGFHVPEGEGCMVLAPDFGGAVLPLPEAGTDPVASAEPGRFYAMTVPDRDNPDVPCAVMPEPIDRGIALRICLGWTRAGVLHVYTPDRGDAEALADEASEGSPKHAPRPRKPAGLPCYRPSPYGNDPTAMVYYRG